MALNIGGLLSGVQGIFGGGSNPYFQNVSNIAGLASNFFQSSRSVPGLPGPSALPIATGGSALMLRGGGMVPRGGMVARGFFNRYPNLGLALQQLRDRGMTVKRSQLYSMLKRFGPEVLITGGLLTAAAVNELMVAGAGRRRMNPANVHALRRSIRRVDSFHKLCVMTDRLRRPRRSSAGKAGSKSQQFVRQG